MDMFKNLGEALFTAAFMALINLFNLFPINPLDGGRIVKSIAFSINEKLGFIFLVSGIIGSFLIIWYAEL